MLTEIQRQQIMDAYQRAIQAKGTMETSDPKSPDYENAFTAFIDAETEFIGLIDTL